MILFHFIYGLVARKGHRDKKAEVSDAHQHSSYKMADESVCQTLHLLGIFLSIAFSGLLMKLNTTNSWRTQWLIPSENCTWSIALCCFSSNKLSVQESTIPVQFLNSFWCKTLSNLFGNLNLFWLMDPFYAHGTWQASGARFSFTEALPNRLYACVLSDLIFYRRQLCHFPSDGGQTHCSLISWIPFRSPFI